jgi:hypothetical protein
MRAYATQVEVLRRLRNVSRRSASIAKLVQPDLIGRRLNAQDQRAEQDPDIRPKAPVIDVPNV